MVFENKNLWFFRGKSAMPTERKNKAGPVYARLPNIWRSPGGNKNTSTKTEALFWKVSEEKLEFPENGRLQLKLSRSFHLMVHSRY
jgi:hypothetical protein